MKQRIHRIIIFLYIVTMLMCITACGKQEVPQVPTEVVNDVDKAKVDLLTTVWINSAREPEKTDSWSVEKYTEDFLPQVRDGELGTLLYAMDNNFCWIFSEIWETGDDGNKSREYQLTKYDMNLAQGETFLYALKWNESITGFDSVIQGMEQLTYHIVGMDCVEEDGQVLSVTDISEVLLKNDFNCSINRMPGAFHKDKKGNLSMIIPTETVPEPS